MPKVKSNKRQTRQTKTSTRIPKQDLQNPNEDSTESLPRRKILSSLITSTPSMQVLNLIKDVKAKYTAAKNNEYASWIKKYMRNKFEYLGIRTPERKSINKEIFSSHPVLSHVDMYQMFYMMWDEPIREYQYFVLDYCDKYIKHINNAKWNDDNLLVLKYLISTYSWWDTVDMLASKDVGIIVSSDVNKYNKIMDDWIQDDNMWLRRTAILHQLNYKQNTDTDRLFRYCLTCAHEDEFFIRKAIGWALRQHFRTDPKLIKDFVKKNESKLSNLSRKEALKHA